MPPLQSRNLLFHYTFPFYLCFLSLFIIILPLKKNADSLELKFTWDSYEEEDNIVGYRIFCREAGKHYDYNNPIWEGTEKFCTLSNLDDQKIYYFVSRALNIHGIDSNDSNEKRYAPLNTAPVALEKSISVYEGTPIDILLVSTDTENDPLSYIIITQPAHGNLSGKAPDLTYTPDAGYSGSDSFSFKVNDGIADSNIAQVVITIYPLEGPPDNDPITNCAIYEDSEDGTIQGWIIYDEDPSGASISNVFDIDRQSRVIELKGSFRDYCYLLHNVDGSKWNNLSQFTAGWRMKCSRYFIVYFNIHTTAGDKYLYYTPVDRDSLGSGYYIHHGVGSKVTDGHWYSFERNLQADLEEAQPGASILEVNGFMVYGSGRVDDIILCKDTSADSGDIPSNSPPIADNKSLITDEDTAINITLTGTDTDLDPLSYTVITHPLHGTLSGTAPTLTYSPNANYNGTDNFTFKANDGQGDSNIATVNITIIPVNDPPVASAKAFDTQEDVAINNTLSASDIDGDWLTYSIITNGIKGNATITDPSTGAFTYT
ncbi:MAG: Ig-like domain-containing protein, partial [bacterium]